ncbi:type I-MYXAN CRISPR-associated protein Cas6/Cmx6 [Halorhodospira halophila]|uniref:type I-MYXAN CRISPR-associated protein Cas6/Cmx6 n=1 Tax=Halorhodospira halophila TaxID=1053 RepID=UPI000316C4A3|nr:type I-MYXAN CRISPR-associated protein Cas6/Cmx6 [Halorhodospira halophila]
MYWETEEEQAPELAEAVDVAFPLRGRVLPEAYAVPLADALAPRLAPLLDPGEVGIRVTHLPTSGHGWWRTPDQPILLPRRSRLVLRVARAHADAVAGLAGAGLDVAGEALELGGSRLSELPAAPTVYAHRVLGPDGGAVAESALLAAARQELAEMDIHPKRLLCGRQETLVTPDGPAVTRSLLVDGMGPEAGRRLQARGLGSGRCWGCGLFLPHKAVT